MVCGSLFDAAVVFSLRNTTRSTALLEKLVVAHFFEK
jgi:hypothetical protein